MKIKISYLFFLLFAFCSAQVGINTLTPHPSSMLDIEGDNVHKTVTIPKIFLKSKTDPSVIKDGKPAHGLMIYNTNPDIKEGKGIYWWDNNYKEWLSVINQESRKYYENLTQFYVAKDNKPLDLTDTPFRGEQAYQKDEALDDSWTELKGLKIDFSINKSTNNLRAVYSGTINLSRVFPETLKNPQSISIGYGIFLDNKLVEAKADIAFFKNLCSLYNFYVNTTLENLEIGKHTLRFAIKKRSKSNEEENGFSIGGAPINYGFYYFTNNGDTIICTRRGSCQKSEKHTCDNINNFEAQPTATLYIVQKP